MAGTGTTRDRVWGSVINERDKAFMATVALFSHGQTSLSLLSLRYMEDEANERGLNHENTS